MPRWPNDESKRQMRLNIIRHRQKLLKYLENINDTVLKPKIKLDPIDLEKLKIKQEPKEVSVKNELIHDTYDDDISVGSNENWNINDHHRYAKEMVLNSTRRSRRIESVQHISKNKNKEDYIYQLDNNVDAKAKKKRVKKSRSTVTINKYERFTPLDRSLHNAKERACRERIAMLFSILSKSCSYLDCSRRIPSKHSILVAAKMECKLLVECEKQLLAEKERLRIENGLLRTKSKDLKKYSRVNNDTNNVNNDD